jgi:predicted nucleic acid-binding protein
MIKLYVEERGSTEVQRRVEEAQVTATSRIAYAEGRAALARKFRDRELTPRDYRTMVKDLDEDWENYFVVDVTENLVKLAGSLSEKHALRGLDAIHLASGVVLRRQGRRDVAFSCFDERLVSAARREGLKVVH